jgi:phosphoenolpyruvate carboxylase
MLKPQKAVADPAKIRNDLAFFIEQLQQALAADVTPAVRHTLNLLLGEKAAEEEVASGSAVVPDPTLLAQLGSMLFRVIALVEENASAQYRRLREDEYGTTEQNGLFGAKIKASLEQGAPPEELTAALKRIRVEPVLTAHPTEAKRATVLEHYRYLYQLLVQRENSMWTRYELAVNAEEIRVALERIWRTGDIFLEKPDVPSELRNIVHYLTTVFPTALLRMDQRLRNACQDLNLDETPFERAENLPEVHFGTWVGGDRDGHPLVTAKVTVDTLGELRRNALALIGEHLRQLGAKSSLSGVRQPAPEEFQSRIAETAEVMGEAGSRALARNPGEPFRQYVNLLLSRLPEGEVRPYHYRRASDLIDDLEHLAEALRNYGAGRLATADVEPVLRIVRTFGFYLAKLDIRQNSAFHDRAVEQLVVASGAPALEFSRLPETARFEFLERELDSSRPFTRSGVTVGKEADAVLSCMEGLRKHISQYGNEGLGSLIVSMTRSLSDLLTVYVLARDSGLLEQTPEGPVCLMPVVPLFETVEDLERSADILAAFLDHPITRRTLERIQRATDADEPVQQVMVGYSDSNKDGGIWASLHSLHQGQLTMTNVARERGVRIRFFHGRGGSISRGAGPTHRFIRALPPVSVCGDLRVTEQGETIAQKYANIITATYNLELLTAGSLPSALPNARTHSADERLERVMADMSHASFATYRELLQTEGFVPFYREATPIDVIEQSRIGSRPSRRTGGQSLADLRAIPWVFSWSQSRFMLSSWYGVGTALGQLKRERPDDFALIAESHVAWAPLHYIVGNVATAMAMADPGIMRLYAGLSSQPAVRDRLLEMILREYDATMAVIEELYQGPLAERRPNVEAMLSLRRSGLALLHSQQVDLLREYRTARVASDDARAAAQLSLLLLTVNAIASGLGTTG